MGDGPSDEHITMLLSMGFSNLQHIKEALSMAKNDLNEAVAILTGEDTRGYSLQSSDTKVVEASNNVDNNNINLALVPADKSLNIEMTESNDEENINLTLDEMPSEFPVTNMYELEQRVFVENWSIPYKVNESFAKCLFASIRLSHDKSTESDENCKRFLEVVLPECIHKLLCSPAVRRWNNETHEGVFSMLQLFVDVVAYRLKYLPIPSKLLVALSEVFDPDSEFHCKNRSFKWDRGYYEDLFGFDKCPAMSPPANSYKDPYGWLVNLVNRFAYKDGINGIVRQIDTMEKMSSVTLVNLLRPLGCCSEYLNQEIIGHQLGGMADKVVQYIQGLQAIDMKEKEIDKVFDLLRVLHQICEALWPDKTSAVESLHLNTILKMFNLPHYNARMNAAKELSKLIIDTERQSGPRYIYQYELILKWLLENKVLSIAFSSNLHHSQYCDKLRKIVDFAGSKISVDEITTIWDMQKEKHITVVQNVHDIIATLAFKSSNIQLDHLMSLFEKSWHEEDEKSKERILLLMGKIGRELKEAKAVIKILELLWNFAHEKQIPVFLVNQAVQSHLDILSDSTVVKLPNKHDYVKKCIEDIVEAKWVVPAIRHILNNLQSATKASSGKDARTAIAQLQEQHGLLKLLTQSMVQCHKKAITSSPTGTFSRDTIINGMHAYSETIVTHLKLIEFILQDGGLYLSWSRCKEIWDCLMQDEENCEGSYETCFEWFISCIADLNAETQKELFTQRILKMDISKFKEVGFNCFKAYFESVNIHEHRIRRSSTLIIVDRQDLTGNFYLWLLALESPYPEIAESAGLYLIDISYSLLSSKLKKSEPVAIHKRFIQECSKKLDLLIHKIIVPSEEKDKKTFKKPLPIKGSGIFQDREKLLVAVERLLNIIRLYINIVEDEYTAGRSFPPHGHCFYGFPVHIVVIHDANKVEFDILSHTNEELKKLREKISFHLNVAVDQLQLYRNNILLSSGQDHKLINYFQFGEKETISAKIMSSIAVVNNEEESLSAKRSSLLEKERGLPSLILASEFRVFEKLYQLAELEEQKLTTAIQKLSLVLPTDGDILQAIDIFGFQNPLSCSPGTRAGYTKNSTSVLENYFKCSGPKMSTFRVLYNLQVLSSRLMPVVGNHSTAITHSFRENWLNAGGLPLIMNILLPDTLPSHADYELRQAAYYIILQLSRYLLCGESFDAKTPVLNVLALKDQTMSADNSAHLNSSQVDTSFMDVSMNSTSTPIKISPNANPNIVASSWPGARNGSPTQQLSSSPGSASCTPENNGSGRKRIRSSSIIESISPTVKMAVESLNEIEYTSTISSLLQVSWAAAAGKLHLNASSSFGLISPSDDEQSLVKNPLDERLKAGICLQQTHVSGMDATLANYSLELLVMCLQLRLKLLNVFYGLPKLKEFIIDILTGSPNEKVRQGASTHLAVLGNTDVMETLTVEHPKKFLLNTLLKAQLPVWTISPNIRGFSFKIMRQCEEYFDLLCNLVYMLPLVEQEEYGLNTSKLLSNELILLKSSENLSKELLNSHIKFSDMLFTCQNIDKDIQGKEFICFLLDDYLFCASKVSTSNNLDFHESSYYSDCRKSAFKLLLNLADRSSKNMYRISKELIKWNHQSISSSMWEFQPEICSRPMNGFVGLKNAGATCYMNSVIQQLYMQPPIHEIILKLDVSKDNSNTTILNNTQIIFGQLHETHKQYYTPQAFWEAFRLWGEPVNLREQQDAFEFFINFTDQLDETLKSLKKDEIFKNIFTGTFVDQKICKDCNHKYERDEQFFSLPITVNCGSLENSLEQFVLSEIMEGDNAYFCEECKEQRTTVKRTCIKSLPPVLAIQLKRFTYDWERNRAIKYNDYFTFPRILDMEPYTNEGSVKSDTVSNPTSSSTESLPSTTKQKIFCITDTNYFYELVGIIVHSGQASAGHYYSYIKNRNQSQGEYNAWYKFNDISVEKVDLNDQMLEAECFGGDYHVQQSENNKNLPEKRTRNWSAYMLFYEVNDKSKLYSSVDPKGFHFNDLGRSYPSSPSSSTSSNPPSPGTRDSLTQLSALVRKGEKKGLFVDTMPAHIKRMVNEENIEFMKNREIYDIDYFSFIRQLVSCNKVHDFNSDTEDPYVCSIELAIHFLLNTYFKTSVSYMSDIDLWLTNIQFLFNQSIDACNWLFKFFQTTRGREYLVSYFLECPNRNIRESFVKVVVFACESYYKMFDKSNISLFENNGKMDDHLSGFINQVLSLLDKELMLNLKHVHQYFDFFNIFGNISTGALTLLIQQSSFEKFYQFIVGPTRETKDVGLHRRWSSAQSQEMLSLYEVVFNMVLSTANDELRTGATEEEGPIGTGFMLPFTSSLTKYWYEEGGGRLIKECLFIYIEHVKLSTMICETFKYSCWCNMQFSVQFIRELTLLLSQVVVNDMTLLFNLLTDILKLSDVHQADRAALCIGGSEEKKVEGILNIIESFQNDDDRRVYQCIKFLVSAGKKVNKVKEYLLGHNEKWQWAVNWLKRKMSDHSCWPATSNVTNDKHTSFQRTVSAQNTLTDATNLLTDFQSSQDTMETYDTIFEEATPLD